MIKSKAVWVDLKLGNTLGRLGWPQVRMDFEQFCRCSAPDSSQTIVILHYPTQSVKIATPFTEGDGPIWLLNLTLLFLKWGFILLFLGMFYNTMICIDWVLFYYICNLDI